MNGLGMNDHPRLFQAKVSGVDAADSCGLHVRQVREGREQVYKGFVSFAHCLCPSGSPHASRELQRMLRTYVTIIHMRQM